MLSIRNLVIFGRVEKNVKKIVSTNISLCKSRSRVTLCSRKMGVKIYKASTGIPNEILDLRNINCDSSDFMAIFGVLIWLYADIRMFGYQKKEIRDSLYEHFDMKQKVQV